MAWDCDTFNLCRPVYFWQALTGYSRAKLERYEFNYNIARMSVATLVNVQLSSEDRMTPSQLWPDWNSSVEVEEITDPSQIEQCTRKAIDFLNSKQ